MVDTFGTRKLPDSRLVEIIRENFDLRPAGIIKMLDLRRPIYKQTAAYGHFGRNDLDLPLGKTGQDRHSEEISGREIKWKDHENERSSPVRRNMPDRTASLLTGNF